jgi:solute carrier organic anion transporter, putative (fragment)
MSFAIGLFSKYHLHLSNPFQTNTNGLFLLLSLSLLLSLFSSGNVPCPIIYGAVVDSACLFWEDNCGQRGACRIYDPAKFRIFFHGLTAAIMFAAFIVDSIVWCKAPSIHLSEEEDKVKNGPLGVKALDNESYL